MIAASWLGRYQHNIDEEDGVTIVQLWQDGDVVRFAYDCSCHTNHGYDLASAAGIVVAVSDTEIAIELRSSKSSSWEDLFKEHSDHSSTEMRQSKLTIVRIEGERPVLRYNGVELTFVGE